MKKLFAMAAAILLAAALPLPAKAVSAKSAVLMDGNTGRILYEKNGNTQSLIASTTKIMTALIVCEQCNVLDRMRVPKEAVGIEGSSMYLQEGEVLTIQDLLYGMMLHSGNDAATALAIYCSGTVAGFAELMNDKASSLGMKNSHFVNPHGLDAPEHYSTAKDLAILATEAMKNPIFATTVAAKSVSAGNRRLTNHNKLLWRVEGANGVKTGYTKAAGRILVSGAKRNGRQLIAVTINAPDDWNDHAAMLEDGFKRYTQHRLISKGDILGVADVAWGTDATVSLIASEDFIWPVAQGEVVSLILPGSGFVYAPVSQGQWAGNAHIMVDGQKVGTIELHYGCTVEQLREEKLSIWKRIFGG